MKKLLILATIVLLGGMVAGQVGAVVPSDYGLKEGMTISASGSSDPDVYIINDAGYKRLFLNPAIFGFYGHLGGFAGVKSVTPAVRDAFKTSGLFRNCETNDPKVYGVETTGEDTGMLRWVNTTGAQAVADDPAFFKKVFCINNSEFNWYSKGTAYTSVTQVPAYSRSTTVTPASGLSATLASDNPAAGTVVETQALATLASMNIAGSGSITNVELKRLGTSGDSTLSAVYLFVNGKRVSDAGNVSSGVITFANGSGLFNAPANVQVRSNIADGKAGETVGVQLTKLNTTAVSVSGNIFNVAANATLSTVDLSAPTGPGDFDPGTDVTVWQSTFSVSNNNTYLKRITFREVGSIDKSDIKNMRLYVDGAQVATGSSLDTDGYVTFLMNQRMLTGSRIVKLVADVTGGSTRTMQFVIKGPYDLEVLDEVYNIEVIPTVASATISSTGPTSSTLGNPSVTVSKATDTPTADVVYDAKDVPLARYTMKGYGEDIKIETLAFKTTFATGGTGVEGLRNGRVLIDGQQYGSTTAILIANTDFTVNYTLKKGSTVTVEVRADIHDSTTDNVGNGDTVLVTWEAGNNNHGQAVTSGVMIDIPGTTGTGAIADVDAATINVVTGSMTLAKYNAYNNRTVTVPASSLKLGHFVLTGASSEDINVNTVNVDVDGADQWTVAKLNNVYVKWDGGQSSTKSTVSGTASNSYSVNFTLVKNQTMNLEVWGSVDTFTVAGANDTMQTNMDVSGTTVSSATSVTGAETFGQTLTAGSGSFAVAAGANTPAKQNVYSGQTVNAMDATFTATNDNYTIKEAKFSVASANAASAVSSVILKDGSTTIGTAPLALLASGSYYASFTGLNIPVVAGIDGKTLTAALTFGDVGVNGATSSANAAVTLAYYKATPSSGGSDATSYAGTAGNAIYVHKSLPLVTAVALPNTALVGGEQTISKFTVQGQGSSIGLKKIKFTITDPAALTITSSSYKIYEDGVDLGLAAGQFVEADTSTGKTMVLTFPTEKLIGTTAKTYELKATLGGTIASGDSFVTQITAPSANAAPLDFANVAAAATFVWSDRTSSSHSATTSDWMNDNLVKNLPLSQALTR